MKLSVAFVFLFSSTTTQQQAEKKKRKEQKSKNMRENFETVKNAFIISRSCFFIT
jgi:hypothetical protein